MSSRIEHFFTQRDRFGNGRALYVVAALAFVLPLALAALRGLRMDNEVERWLPEEDREAQVLGWHREQFPQGDQLIISWDGSSLRDPRVQRFANSLRGTVDEIGIRRDGCELIDSVVTADEVLAQMIDARVDATAATERLQGTLIGVGPLRVKLSETADRSEVGQDLAALASSILGRDATAGPPAYEFANPADENASADVPDVITRDIPTIPRHDLTLTWPQSLQGAPETAAVIEALQSSELVEAAFFHAGSPVALLATLSEAGVAERPALIEELNALAVEAGVDADQLHIGGSAAASVALNKGARTSSWNTRYPIWNIPFRSPFLMSAIIGAGIALLALRSMRLGILVLAVSYTTTLLAVACVPLAGDSLNMVLVVMPTLLTVLTLSGAIHVANYWRHEANISPSGAVGRAVRQAWAPCLLASTTTAVGLLSLLNSTLTPVRQFGLYSAIGCGIALLMVLFGLPSLLQIWRGKSSEIETRDERRWTAIGVQLGKYWGPIAVLCLACGALATYGLTRFQTETKVIRYFPQDAAIVADYHALESTLAGITPLDLVVRFDSNAQEELDFLERMETVRAVSAAISDHPEVTGTLSLSDFQPVHEKPSSKASTFQKIRFRQKIRRIEQEAKSGRGEAFLTVATETSALTNGNGVPLSREGDELWRISAQASVMSDADYGELMSDLNTRASQVLTPVTGATHVVTGMVPLFFRTQQAVLESLIRSFGLAFGLIAIVMMALLRSLSGGLIAMVPNLLPVGLVFGLISWCGQRVDIGTMITASVALGVAVDGTLHLLTWFRRGLDAGLNRLQATSMALGHCGPAMWQTSMAVGLCLLALMPAELLLISRFGWLMAALIGAALLADVVLLPALLAGPLGMILESKKARSLIRQRSSVRESTGDRKRQTRETAIPEPHRRRDDDFSRVRRSA